RRADGGLRRHRPRPCDLWLSLHRQGQRASGSAHVGCTRLMREQSAHLEAFDRLVESSRGPATEALPPPIPRREIAEELVSLLEPNSFAADQYRTLRHSIELLQRECGLRVLAITSPTPGDGKS